MAIDNRQPVPLDIVKAIIERKNAGMTNPSIEIDNGGNIIPRGRGNENLSDHTVIVRSSTRAGPPEQSSRARALRACKGTKGCEFVACMKDAMGSVPKHLKKLEERCEV